MERCNICGGRYKAMRHHKARMHRAGSLRRVTRSFSLDGAVARQIETTRGSRSASDRVNTLLKRALEAERYVQLEREAAEFFSGSKGDRDDERAFREAALKVWTRE